MNKTIIYEFDPAIYPVGLWIMIAPNLNEVSGNFRYFPSMEEIETDESNKFIAITHFIENKSNEDRGVLITFSSIDWCSAHIVAHEATHAARLIWEYLGEKTTGMEADAYLVGWIVKCIEKVKLNKL